jgi:hypothetical protein
MLAVPMPGRRECREYLQSCGLIGLGDPQLVGIIFFLAVAHELLIVSPNDDGGRIETG